MKVLELFAGGRSFSKVAEQNGHTTFDTDIEQFEGIDLAIDILEFEPHMCPFTPDVIWASPPCETFSVASIGRHWTSGHAFKPKTERAEQGVKILERLIGLLQQYIRINPDVIWFVENPRGKMRKAPQWEQLDHVRRTVTYCQYGDFRMKPTDIWTNNTTWEPRPTCKNGDPCHESAPRSSKTGTSRHRTYLAKSAIPPELCQEIVTATEPLIQTTYMTQTIFSNHTDVAVFEAYQRECENIGWTSSRADYLADLHIEMEQRFDCSEIIDGNSMSLRTKNVELVGNKVIVK